MITKDPLVMPAHVTPTQWRQQMQYLDTIHFWVLSVQVEGEAVGDVKVRWDLATKPKCRDHLVTVIWSQHTGH